MEAQSWMIEFLDDNVPFQRFIEYVEHERHLVKHVTNRSFPVCQVKKPAGHLEANSSSKVSAVGDRFEAMQKSLAEISESM